MKLMTWMSYGHKNNNKNISLKYRKNTIWKAFRKSVWPNPTYAKRRINKKPKLGTKNAKTKTKSLVIIIMIIIIHFHHYNSIKFFFFFCCCSFATKNVFKWKNRIHSTWIFISRNSVTKFIFLRFSSFPNARRRRNGKYFSPRRQQKSR